jgi:hypothetical protein
MFPNLIGLNISYPSEFNGDISKYEKLKYFHCSKPPNCPIPDSLDIIDIYNSLMWELIITVNHIFLKITYLDSRKGFQFDLIEEL